MMTHISEDRMNMEWKLPKLFDKAKAVIMKDTYMKFYDET